MKHRFAYALLVLASAVLPACGGGGLGGGNDPAVVPGTTMSALELEMAHDCFDMVNEERVRRGGDALLWSDEAAQAAYLHAVDMQQRSYFDHFDPEGHSPGYRMTQQGVSWTYNGENIAYGYDSAGDVMDGWMDSEGHRDNILHPIFTHIGIGVWLGPGGPFWVQDFYTP